MAFSWGYPVLHPWEYFQGGGKAVPPPQPASTSSAARGDRPGPSTHSFWDAFPAALFGPFSGGSESARRWDEQARFREAAARRAQNAAWKEYKRMMRHARVYVPTEADLAHQAWRENQKMMRRAAEVYDVDRDAQDAWNEYRNMMRRSREMPAGRETDQQAAARAWEEYHKMMQRSHSVLDDDAPSPTDEHPDPEADQERSWEEYHKMMERSRVHVPSEEELAWEEYHKMINRSMLPRGALHPSFLPGSKKSLRVLHDFYRAPKIHFLPSADRFVMVADCPGVTKEDLNVHIKDFGGAKFIEIAGTRRLQSSQDDSKDASGTVSSHVLYGSFVRSFRLPDNVDTSADRMTTKYEAGSLTVSFPYLSPPVKAVPVKVE